MKQSVLWSSTHSGRMDLTGYASIPGGSIFSAYSSYAVFHSCNMVPGCVIELFLTLFLFLMISMLHANFLILVLDLILVLTLLLVVLNRFLVQSTILDILAKMMFWIHRFCFVMASVYGEARVMWGVACLTLHHS